MSHDLLAELAGYESELAGYGRRPERAEEVRGEIDRVIGQIKTEIEHQLTKAEGHEDAGEDLAAAQARVEAKRLAAALPAEHRPAKLRALFPDEAGADDAAQAPPPERAVPRKRPAGKAAAGEAGA